MFFWGWIVVERCHSFPLEHCDYGYSGGLGSGNHRNIDLVIHTDSSMDEDLIG